MPAAMAAVDPAYCRFGLELDCRDLFKDHRRVIMHFVYLQL